MFKLLAKLRNPQQLQTVAAAPEEKQISQLFPPGHFYSPIADPADLKARAERIWAPATKLVGIDLNVDEQLELLRQLEQYQETVEYPVEQPDNPSAYFYKNDQFPVLDAEFLHAALCHFRPRSVIEVGSGFSSLITAGVNRQILNNAIDFTCIEPYPRQFLIDGVDGISNLVRKKVEDVELSFFDRLKSGDILFVDSSHVAKIGSDVNYLFFEVIPRLNPGVMVHIHDVFLPDEYPKVWAIDEGRNWNEQYVLRAFLQFNNAWKVLWSAYYMATRQTQAVMDVFPRFPLLGGGGSFWMVRR